MGMTGLIGQRVEHYQIEKLLGMGGMGAVYQATDLRLQRQVAIKVMHPQLAVQQQFQQRFLQEARAAAGLEHPNIVRVHAFGMQGDQLFLVMEFVSGGSLRSYLRRLYEQRKTLELNEAIEFTRQVAQALHYAHAHQPSMVHRDVKPDNALLKLASDPGGATFQALLSDFGLAKLAEGSMQTSSGQPLGTLPYMSPEQCTGAPLDGRADIYSLGVMLYELAVGRLPYQPRTLMDAVTMHTSTPLPPPEQVRPGLPPELNQIIQRSLAKQPNERYPRAGDMAAALQQVQVGLAAGKYRLPATSPTQTESLATFLMSMPGAMLEPMPVYTQQPLLPDQVGQDRLIIVGEGQPTRSIPLHKETIQLGRAAEENDVALEASKVSRVHARIERDRGGRYSVMDLGSTNGTWLGSARLLANTPQTFEYGQTLRIGGFWIKLEKAGSAPPPPGAGSRYAQGGSPANLSAGNLSRMPSLRSGGMMLQSTFGSVQIELDPGAVNLTAGGRGEVQVKVVNQGETVDHFTPRVVGLPPDWVTVPGEAVQLLPADNSTFAIKFHPPRASTSTAGEHTFQVEVFSHGQQRPVGAIPGSLKISPFAGYSVDLQPRRLRGRGILRLEVRNKGNAPVSFRITAQDREQGLDFNVVPSRLAVPPGNRGTVDIQVEPRSRPLLGTPHSYPFEVQIVPETSDDPPQVQAGDLLAPPRLPSWLLGLASLAVVGCLGLGVLLLVLDGGTGPDQGGQLDAQATLAQSTANAAQQQQDTFAAQTAAAPGGAGEASPSPPSADSDSDGLPDSREQELGTNPNNPDTDGDGLTDGQEANSFGTNPLLLDSDNDNLSDGQEVERGTNPNNPDTDGDGLLDNVDPNPGQPPTATTPPPSTLAATATPPPTLAPATVTATLTLAPPTHTPFVPTNTPTPFFTNTPFVITTPFILTPMITFGPFLPTISPIDIFIPSLPRLTFSKQPLTVATPPSWMRQAAPGDEVALHLPDHSGSASLARRIHSMQWDGMPPQPQASWAEGKADRGAKGP